MFNMFKKTRTPAELMRAYVQIVREGDKNLAQAQRDLRVLHDMPAKGPYWDALQAVGLEDLDADRFLAAKTIGERFDCVDAALRLRDSLGDLR